MVVQAPAGIEVGGGVAETGIPAIVVVEAIPQPKQVLQPSAKVQPAVLLSTDGPLVTIWICAQPGLLRGGLGTVTSALQDPGNRPIVIAGKVSFVLTPPEIVSPTKKQVVDCGKVCENETPQEMQHAKRSADLRSDIGLVKLLNFMRCIEFQVRKLIPD